MKTIVISSNAHPLLLNYLKNEGYNIEYITENQTVYPQICTHADIFFCKTQTHGGGYIKAESGEIGYSYPQNIAFNAVCTEKYFIHNIKYTNKRLLEYVKAHSITPVNVKQGYTKCSTVVVNQNSFITSDSGIYKALSDFSDISVLKISEGYVKLNGFTHGFLGGASGHVNNTVVFNGNITAHPDFLKIERFIKDKNVNIKYFNSYELCDIGSILEIEK